MKKLNKSLIVKNLKLKLLLWILKIYTHIFIVDVRCIEISDCLNSKNVHGEPLKEFCGWDYCKTNNSCSDRYGRYSAYVRHSYKYAGYNVVANTELGCYLKLLKRILADGSHGPMVYPLSRSKYEKGE